MENGFFHLFHPFTAVAVAFLNMSEESPSHGYNPGQPQCSRCVVAQPCSSKSCSHGCAGVHTGLHGGAVTFVVLVKEVHP